MKQEQVTFIHKTTANVYRLVDFENGKYELNVFCPLNKQFFGTVLYSKKEIKNELILKGGV